MFRHVPAWLHHPALRHSVAAAALIAGVTSAFAAEREFPFGRELMLDAKPMKGSKRVPILGIGPKGEASLELWCNTVKGRIEVAADTITITAETTTDQQCAPERMRGDEELLAALMQVTKWQRAGDVLTLRGPKTLRFRTATH